MMRPPRAGATLAVLCLLAMAGCEQPGGTSSRPQPPAVPAEKESGLAAGMLVITLKSAIDGIEIQRPATVKTGAQQAQWTPAESAKLTQLDSRAAHTISVEGPYLADRVDVKFDDSASGKRVEILVLPRFVDGSEPSESERPIAKYLEILLSQDGSAKASWMQRGTAVSTFDLPAAGPVGPTLQEQWSQHAVHMEPSDPQKDSLRLLFPEDVPVAGAARFVERLELPKRPMRSPSGLQDVAAFDVLFGRPEPPPSELAPLDETLQALTAVGLEDATSGGFDKLVTEVLRSCETAICKPETVTQGWERLAVSLATSKRMKEAEDAFFVARVSRLRPLQLPDSAQDPSPPVVIVEPKDWLDESHVPEAARQPYRAALERKMVHVRQGAVGVSGRVPARDVMDAVLTRVGPIATCYAVGLTKNEHLQGGVAARFVTEADGHVSTVANVHSDMPDDGVVGCVLREFRRLPPLVPKGGILTVTFPFHFSPGAP